jgi:hypothetical protein
LSPKEQLKGTRLKAQGKGRKERAKRGKGEESKRLPDYATIL